MWLPRRVKIAPRYICLGVKTGERNNEDQTIPRAHAHWTSTLSTPLSFEVMPVIQWTTVPHRKLLRFWSHEKVFCFLFLEGRGSGCLW